MTLGSLIFINISALNLYQHRLIAAIVILFTQFTYDIINIHAASMTFMYNSWKYRFYLTDVRRPIESRYVTSKSTFSDLIEYICSTCPPEKLNKAKGDVYFDRPCNIQTLLRSAGNCQNRDYFKAFSGCSLRYMSIY